MVNTVKLLSDAARDSVQDISEPYDNYHAELVYTFTRVIQILQSEPGNRVQRRAIEDVVKGFAGKSAQNSRNYDEARKRTYHEFQTA